MSEFFKLAYELIAQIIYNISEWVANFVKGFIKVFITGWVEYRLILESYFPTLPAVGKVLAVILVIVLAAIPVTLLILLIRSIVVNIRLRADGEDNVVLYREIGRLNKQVLDLIDEKNRILNMKIGTKGDLSGTGYAGADALNGTAAPVQAVSGASGGVIMGESSAPGTAIISSKASIMPSDPFAEAPEGVGMVGTFGAVGGVGAGMSMGVGMGMGSAASGEALQSAAIAAATAAASVKSQAELELENSIHRFPKLSLVDTKYENYVGQEFDDSVTLFDFAERYRRFASSQMHLYYTPEIVRRFIAGMAASHILILEGISGTGKTSLPYSFSRYIGNPATMVSVQPSYRDRSELLGYFNEFSKKFNETEFLRALYEAGYRDDPTIIVLDEMNLARIEYYFAEMLSVLEMPDKDEWIVDLVPTAWPGDPEQMDGGKIHVSEHTWFVGTANSDDSTFTITDKVYDRAMPIELNQRADAFECELEPRCCVSVEHLQEMFSRAKEDHPISDATLARMVKMDNYLQTRFKLAFGNRILKQMYDFIPVYVACGGTETGGLDYILARKVLKKFESMNISFVRDEIKNLLVYMEKVFGSGELPDSIEYLNRIQNMY